MSEKIIQLEAVNPIDLYGINDNKLELLKNAFPKLKVIARGDTIKVIGDETEIELFEVKLNRMVEHFHKYGNINENNIERILETIKEESGKTSEEAGDVLVFGNSGLLIKARSVNQRRMVDSYAKNDMVFAIGPAGTGKTYTAVALAVRALKNKEIRKIILTRPAVEAGENLGFLPGDLKEKLDPYLQPLYDALRDMLPPEKLASYIETGIIQIAPLAFMRGRTLDNAFVILDEAQNATESQLKMFLTRMGKTAKFYITGDLTQVDLPRNQKSGLVHAHKLLQNLEGIDFVFLDNRDVLRHKLVKAIISAYESEQTEIK
ncbi:MAG: PhoH family protein [Bacteroidetes bacterium]|nr:PhoH family protein [Bacteroidota bacterium]HET6243078.1 PhoH family protein [Bacteroidia bacterium]